MPDAISATLELAADPAPGPGTRVARTGGQVGGVIVIIDLWQAFGWFGADTWTAEQAAARWPAISATLYFAVAVAHNLYNWWRTERIRPLESVTVSGSGDVLGSAPPSQPKPPRAPRRQRKPSTNPGPR